MARRASRAPGVADPGAEASVGRSLALLALESIARQNADHRVREETEQREKEEAARRAKVRAQLGRTVKREWWFFVGWNVIWALILLPTSLPLTFAPPKADPLVSLEAALHYQWIPLLVAAGIVLTASAAYNVERFRARKTPPGEAETVDFIVLGLALPGVFLAAASQDGAVPPSAWSYAPLLPAVAFVIVILARLLRERHDRPEVGKLLTLLSVVVVLGLAWILAPRSDLPAVASQVATDRSMSSALPRARCGARSVAALPAGLFRNSLDGLIRCRQGGIRGRAMQFRNTALLNIYVSQREDALRSSAERISGGCGRATGVAMRTWYDRFDSSYPIGRVHCYGGGAAATIEWSDTRTDTFAKFRGYSRASLYRWWRRHAWALHRSALRGSPPAGSAAGD